MNYELDIANPQRLEVKRKIDRMLNHDYQILRKVQTCERDLDQLQSKRNNPLIYTYIQSIYGQYNIIEPLQSLQQNQSKQSDACQKTEKKIKKFVTLRKNRVDNLNYETPIKSNFSGESQESPTLPQKQNQIKLKSRKDPYQEKELGNFSIASNSLTIQKNKLQDSEQQDKLTVKNQGNFFQPSLLKQSIITQKAKKNQAPKQNQYPWFKNEKEDIQLSNTKLVNNKNNLFIEKEICLTSNEQQSLNYGYQMPVGTNIFRNELKDKQIGLQGNKIKVQFHDQIKDNFRYCIGCERALLDVNINIHGNKCEKFLQILELQGEGIVKILKGKIRTLEQNIKIHLQDLSCNSPQKFKEVTVNLMNQSKNVCISGVFTKRYDQQYCKSLEISKKWVEISEEINKVNWFLKIRENINRMINL